MELLEPVVHHLPPKQKILVCATAAMPEFFNNPYRLPDSAGRFDPIDILVLIANLNCSLRNYDLNRP